jgi:transcriptional regulator with XRE-family HTH domain
MSNGASIREVIDVVQSIGPLIKSNRARLGLSLREAGEQAGVPFTTLNRWERGERLPFDGLLQVLEWLAK